MASDWRTSFPVVGAVLDAAGNVVLNDITETVPIREGYAKLTQVPYKDTKVDNNVTIQGFTEISSGAPKATEFRVNYTTGRVYFNDVNNTLAVTVTYKGKGTLVGIDEINWLWEQVTTASEAKAYYVTLADTPDVLMPHAVQAADATGTRITQISPEIGRSYSDTTLLTSFSGNYRIHGSVFDWFTAWKLTQGSTSTDNIDLSAGYTDTLLFYNGKYTASGTTGKYYATVSFVISKAKKVASVALEGVMGDLRLLLAISGMYYRYTGSGWEKLGTANTLRTLDYSRWNTPAELANVRNVDMSFLADVPLNVAVFCQDGASFAPMLDVTYAMGVNFERTDFTAAFDKTVEEWVINFPILGDYALVRGSGKDDVSCTSEVIEFTDVMPGETVSVTAPVRTNVNVLIGDTVQQTSMRFPSGTRGWGMLPWDVTHPEQTYSIPCAATAAYATTDTIKALFSGISASTQDILLDFRDGSVKNLLNSGYGETWNTVNNFFPAMSGMGILVHHDTDAIGDNSISGIKVGPESSPRLGGGHSYTYSYFAYTIGCLARVDSGAAVIFSASVNGSSARGMEIIIENGKLYFRINGGARSTPITLPSLGYAAIVATNCYIRRVTSGYNDSKTTVDAFIDVYVNGGAKVTMMATYVYSGNIGAGATSMSYVGPSPLNSSSTDFNGTAIIECPFYLNANITSAAAQKISAGFIALDAARQLSESTAWAASTTRFMEGITDSDPILVSIEKVWNFVLNEPLFAFYNSSRLFTIDRNTLQVVNISSAASYDDLHGICANITTLRAKPDLLNTSLFRNSVLVTISKDFGRGKQLYGVPGQLTTTRSIAENYLKLASTSDASVKYADGKWLVTNKTSTKNIFRIAVLGGGLNLDNVSADVPLFFAQLLDTPSDLNDVAPKALVSHNGAVEKALRVHPYLLGGI